MASKTDDRQVGGSHYTAQRIQHWDYVAAMYGEGYFKGQITKYISRYRLKNGLQDLLKAQHFMEKLIELRLSPRKNVVAVQYCTANSMGQLETNIVIALENDNLLLAEWNIAQLIHDAEQNSAPTQDGEAP